MYFTRVIPLKIRCIKSIFHNKNRQKTVTSQTPQKCFPLFTAIILSPRLFTCPLTAPNAAKLSRRWCRPPCRCLAQPTLSTRNDTPLSLSKPSSCQRTCRRLPTRRASAPAVTSATSPCAGLHTPLKNGTLRSAFNKNFVLFPIVTKTTASRKRSTLSFATSKSPKRKKRKALCVPSFAAT